MLAFRVCGWGGIMTGRCVTCGRVGSDCIRLRSGVMIHVYGIKTYVLKKRRKDGVYTWRLESAFDLRTGPQLSMRLVRAAREYANANNLEFRPYVQHGIKEKLSDLEIIALETALTGDAPEGGIK